MKSFIFAVLAAFTVTAFAQPAKAPNGQITDAVTQKAVQNDNCVKKDKNGKCPPLPNSPKPTPKKKIEEKK